MPKAIWNGTVVAETERFELVEIAFWHGVKVER
jgi:uncharacterized protein (DUF427 family)